MPLYECVFIARNDVTQQQVEAIADQVAASSSPNGGGEVKKREYWGLRGLAYRIKKNRKGALHAPRHRRHAGRHAGSRAPARPERGRAARHDLRVEEIDEAPSAILSRRGEERDRTAASAARARPGASAPAAAASAATTARNSAPARATRSTPSAGRRGVSRHVRSDHARHQPGRPPSRRRRPPALLSPPQVLPVLRPERAEDRLQGRAPAVPLPVGARQDRAEPHHRGVSAKKQRELADAIKRARFLALLPYVIND